MNNYLNKKSGQHWFYLAFFLPHIVMIFVSIILSLFWSNAWDMPGIGNSIINVQLLPELLALGTLIYCLYKFQFERLGAKLLKISIVIVYTIFTLPFLGIMISCNIWNDCL